MAKKRSKSKNLGITPIQINLQEVDALGSIECGFRQEWIEANSDDCRIVVLSGAGGSPWLIVQLTHEETTRYFRYDIREFVKHFVSKVVE